MEIIEIFRMGFLKTRNKTVHIHAHNFTSSPPYHKKLQYQPHDKLTEFLHILLNWGKFGIKIFLLVQPMMKLKLTKKFDSDLLKWVYLWYEITHPMYCSCFYCSALSHFTVIPHPWCQLEATSSHVCFLHEVVLQHYRKEKWNLLEVVIVDAWVKDFCNREILALQLY